VLDTQFEELRLTGRLPSPTGVGLKILALTQRDDASIDDVAGVLQTDPTLTGRLLKLANSGTNGGRSVATTAHAAAVRLGLQSVRNISLGFSLLAGNRSGRCQTFDYDGFWSHSLAVAAAAQTVAEFRGHSAPTEAFTCGLLLGMGRLALASIHPSAYEGVLERARGLSSARLAEIEKDNFGMDHREVAAAMLRDWRLPEHFALAVAQVGSGAAALDLRTPDAVQLALTLQDARDLARALTADIDASPAACQRMRRELERMQERLKLDDAALEALWASVMTNWAGWGEVMSIRAKATLGIDDIRQRANSECPVAQAVESTVVTARAEPQARSVGLRILVVGRELSRDTGLQDLLTERGHTLFRATQCRDGLRLALEHAPHLVLCDWDSSHTDALQLVSTLRQSELGSRLHFLVVADREMSTRLLEAFEAGVDEYVFRPFDPRIVAARAGAALRFVQLDERVQDLLAEREGQIGQLAILTRKLQVAAVTDPLTGLFNRRFAVERLQRAFDLCRNGTLQLSVIAMDIDRFKSVNDVHGHDTGDVVLRETAKLAAARLRKGDALCRMGGEEFLAICPGADLAAGVEIAERLRSSVRENIIRFGTFDRAVTVSLGVAQCLDEHADMDALLKVADRRVYLAKEGGRDRVVAHDLLVSVRAAG